jgi:hypothetical protein
LNKTLILLHKKRRVLIAGNFVISCGFHQATENKSTMFPGIKKILRIYTDSAWIPFLLMMVFLLIASILVVSGGVHTQNSLSYPTNLAIKLYACALLGQLYISFVNFFGKGTKTGTIQLILFLTSLLLSFFLFIYFLVPHWKKFFGI